MALGNIREDQFEAAHAQFVADLTAWTPLGASPIVISMTANFPDGSSQTIVKPGV